jgi:hypothetical protein
MRLDGDTEAKPYNADGGTVHNLDAVRVTAEQAIQSEVREGE